ncbi:MAG: cobalt-precorrin-5B (C(1))-methyltransferase CbiD [Hungatella sp.]
MEKQALRSGFTTGTCAAAAAKAAAACLLLHKMDDEIAIVTPKGLMVHLKAEADSEDDKLCCFRVQKDAGDDPDVTNAAWIYASVENRPEKIEPVWYQSEQFPQLYLTGGRGIGMVTKPGLACPVGKYAINPIPRQMIYEAVAEVAVCAAYVEDLLIRIQIPEGVKLAEKTFNPKLGIVGGISILGTSGIVEPMSEQALLDTIRLEIHMQAAMGRQEIILTPGNYGEHFLQEELQLPLSHAVKCSNFVADTIAMLEEEGITSLLFVGHLGKLIKVAGGVPNTHSKYGDRRMEILAGYVRNPDLGEQIQRANTTEDALEMLQKSGCMETVMDAVVRAIQEVLMVWSHGKIRIEVVTFSLVYGILGKSRDADSLIEHWKRENL